MEINMEHHFAKLLNHCFSMPEACCETKRRAVQAVKVMAVQLLDIYFTVCIWSIWSMVVDFLLGLDKFC